MDYRGPILLKKFDTVQNKLIIIMLKFIISLIII